MKARIAISLLAVATLLPACMSTEPADLAIRGVTLIDGSGDAPTSDANVVIRSNRIVCAGPADSCPIPDGTRTLDGVGRWVTPGLIDSHVHFAQSGWIDARPETAGRPVDDAYQRAIDDLREHPERAFRAMLCSGITAVADVGGYSWTVELARRAESDSLAPRVAAAGPLLTFINYPLAYRGESQMVYLSDSATVRSAVAELASLDPDFIKLWYIVDPRRGVDSVTARALAELAALEVKARELPLVVHATGLWEATHAVELGADVLVHSVFGEPVDEHFIELARETGVIYTPTIAVVEGYVYMRNGVFASERHDLRCADPTIVEAWESWAAAQGTEDRAAALARARESIRSPQAVTLENLRRLHAAGVTVALGTDSGNPMTFHGSAILYELELMHEAGLTPMEVIVNATRNGARLLGRGDELGTLEAGKLADLLLLESDPLQDLSAFSRIESVVRGGVLHRRAELLPAR